jgi:IS4 transposase
MFITQTLDADSLSIRELSVGGKLLITTLLCPKKTTKEELKALYSSRWQIELDFRNLKTTLGMVMLRGRSPQMVEKEIWVYHPRIPVDTRQ